MLKFIKGHIFTRTLKRKILLAKKKKKKMTGTKTTFTNT